MGRKLSPTAFHLLAVTLAAALVFPATVSSLTVDPTSAKYQVECKMCAACENPCGQNPSPPPPPPPPKPICPPPPKSSGSGSYYPPPPPPPYQPTYTYSPPTSGGGAYYPPPSGDGNNYAGTPPPNPIVPYFPFYYYSPPPPKSGAEHLRVGCAVSVSSLLLGFWFF